MARINNLTADRFNGSSFLSHIRIHNEAVSVADRAISNFNFNFDFSAVRWYRLLSHSYFRKIVPEMEFRVLEVGRVCAALGVQSRIREFRRTS